nr:MAG TPA: hypothetical protein [Bacteriophage sp.]
MRIESWDFLFSIKGKVVSLCVICALLLQKLPCAAPWLP